MSSTFAMDDTERLISPPVAVTSASEEAAPLETMNPPKESSVQRFPRLYYLFVFVLVPLFALIGLCFCFGHFLAALEASPEVTANDAALREAVEGHLNYQAERATMRESVKKISSVCFQQRDNDIETDNPFLDGCLERIGDEIAPNEFLNFLAYVTGNKNLSSNEEILPMVQASQAMGLTFHWITCPRKQLSGSTRDDKIMQFAHYSEAYEQDFQRLLQEQLERTGNKTQATQYAMQHATGATDCKTYTVGGAVFWFTVMTTVGYGNTSPVTQAGRSMVYTCGFVSIIAFGAVLAQAGDIVLTIVDDALVRHRYTKILTQGFPSVIFWLAIFVGWIAVTAGVIVAFGRARIFADYPWNSGFWMAYITLTTVGLGDYNIRHEEVRAGEMFYIPLVCLTGFVFLSTFSMKLAHLMATMTPQQGQALEDLLKAKKAAPSNNVQNDKAAIHNEKSSAQQTADQAAQRNAHRPRAFINAGLAGGESWIQIKNAATDQGDYEC